MKPGISGVPTVIAETNPTSNHEIAGLIPGLAQWVKDLTWCRLQLWLRSGSELMSLWLWCRLAAAAPIQPLAWELPYATQVVLKRRKKEERKEGRKEERKEGKEPAISMELQKGKWRPHKALI